MTKETLKKLVCRYVYHSDYSPENAMQADWEKLRREYEQEPGVITDYLKNESRVNFYEQELALVENKIQFLQEILQELETKNERWFFEEDVLYRYRTKASIERSALLEGPKGVAIEEWIAYFYNLLIEYQAEIQAQVGIAAKGDIGEQRVADRLEKSKYADFVLHNIVLDVSDEGGKTNEIDTYVITSKGIFVLEVKNYGKADTILKITDDDKWDLLDKKTGRVIKQEKNPTYQNIRHTNATIKKIKEWMGKDIPVFPLVVIGNNAVTLEFHTNLTVKNVQGLLSYMDSVQGNDVLTKEEMSELKRLFEQADIGSNAFTAKTYREQIYYMMDIVEQIYPFLGYNQVAKEFYYKMLERLGYVLLGVVAVVLLGILFVTKRIDILLIGLLGMSVIITIVFGVILVLQKCKEILGWD